MKGETMKGETMKELTMALQMVLIATITLGIPVGILFLVGCLLHYGGALQAFMSRLSGGTMGRSESSSR